MNKIIRRKKTHILPLILSAIAISVSSCGSNPNNTENQQETTSKNEYSIPNSSSPAPSSETKTPEIEITTKPSPTKKAVPFGVKTPASPSPSPETPNQNKAANLKNSDITMYTSDLECQKLVPQKVSVSANEPVKDTVGKIIASKNTADLNISNYRVNIKNGIATVDLRVPPDSPRQLVSLSSCEQFTLFQSIQKTLTSNPKWKIKNVRFTQSGEEIIL